jgi:hypothetical protein
VNESLAELRLKQNRVPEAEKHLLEITAERARTGTRLFRNLKTGTSLAEALRQAQVELLRSPQYRQPFHWAPYILIGDWR